MYGMPHADRITLTAAGLTMPSVDTLSNKGFQNVTLDRAFGGTTIRPSSKAAAARLTRADVALFMNLTRLVDKALREYDASRDALTRYVNPPDDQLRTSGYVIAVDHMENCISAAHRAVVITETLRARGYGRSAPRLTNGQQERLGFLRNARTLRRANLGHDEVEEDQAVCERRTGGPSIVRPPRRDRRRVDPVYRTG